MSLRQWLTLTERSKLKYHLSVYGVIGKLLKLTTDALLQKEQLILAGNNEVFHNDNNNNNNNNDNNEMSFGNNAGVLQDLQALQNLLTTIGLQLTVQVLQEARNVYVRFEKPGIQWGRHLLIVDFPEAICVAEFRFHKGDLKQLLNLL